MRFKKHILIRVISFAAIISLVWLANAIKTDNIKTDNNPVSFNDDFSVHLLDVGQADSILIQNDEWYMLIDAGNRGDNKIITDYLEEFGVKDLNYFIGTHSHEDHIGSAADIINEFNPANILLPKRIAGTKVFEEMLLSIQNNGKEITVPTIGKEFFLGDDSFIVLSPDKEKEDTNNNSIVIMYTHTNPNGDTKWLFMGDAEADIEAELLESNFNLDADVLKVGHHGSNTSSSQDFIEAVSPEVALISVGKDNKYGHPHDETLETLNGFNINVLRTDEKGAVVLGISDNGEIYEK